MHLRFLRWELIYEARFLFQTVLDLCRPLCRLMVGFVLYSQKCVWRAFLRFLTSSFPQRLTFLQWVPLVYASPPVECLEHSRCRPFQMRDQPVYSACLFLFRFPEVLSQDINKGPSVPNFHHSVFHQFLHFSLSEILFSFRRQLVPRISFAKPNGFTCMTKAH